MRIAFDGTTLCPGRTGVGYYTEHLLHHLSREAAGDDLLVLSNRPIETAVPLPPAVRLVANRPFPLRMLWLQLVAPRLLARLNVDVAHFTNAMVPVMSGVPKVVTIHDMSLTLYPGYHPVRRVLLNRPLVNLAARMADAIITVSHSARRDILRLYQVPPERVRVIHEAAAPGFVPTRDPARLAEIRKRYGLADRVILYVGTIEPRKNLPRLMEAFAERRRHGELPHQLVCVGPYGWSSADLHDRIGRLGIADAVRFTGYVPFADLPAIYGASEMFVFPSLYEGFGLPVIEAMACGVPVIASRTSSLTEITGGAVEEVDPLDRDDLGAALVRLARHEDRRQELRDKGLGRAQEFSWTRAARQTLEVYRVAARVHLPAPGLQPSSSYSDIALDPLSANPGTPAREQGMGGPR